MRAGWESLVTRRDRHTLQRDTRKQCRTRFDAVRVDPRRK